MVSGPVPMVVPREKDVPVTGAFTPFTVTITGVALVVTVPVTVAAPPGAPGSGRTASSAGAPKSAVRSSSGARSSCRASVRELKLLSVALVVPVYCAGGAFMRPMAALPSKVEAFKKVFTRKRPFGAFWGLPADQLIEVKPAGALSVTFATRKSIAGISAEIAPAVTLPTRTPMSPSNWTDGGPNRVGRATKIKPEEADSVPVEKSYPKLFAALSTARMIQLCPRG